MKYTITRRQIIKALKTEPLGGGQWINLENQEDFNNAIVKAADVKCTVCAVGAVLRGALGRILTVEQLHNSSYDLCSRQSCDYEHVPDYTGGYNYSLKEAREYASEGLKKHKMYLASLSSFFEDMYYNIYNVSFAVGRDRGPKMRAIRYQLVKFIKENFPKEIKVKI